MIQCRNDYLSPQQLPPCVAAVAEDVGRKHAGDRGRCRHKGERRALAFCWESILMLKHVSVVSHSQNSVTCSDLLLTIEHKTLKCHGSLKRTNSSSAPAEHWRQAQHAGIDVDTVITVIVVFPSRRGADQCYTEVRSCRQLSLLDQQ